MFQEPIPPKGAQKPNEAFQNFSLFLFLAGLIALAIYSSFGLVGVKVFFASILGVVIAAFGILSCVKQSKEDKNFDEKCKKYLDLPDSLKKNDEESIYLGHHKEVDCPIFLKNSIRSRHMQILGGTGTGKTESVIFNLIKQDINNHHPVVVIDGKGDLSFLRFLERFSPKSTLKVFDLNGEGSLSYNPLDNGSAIEASERLFNSLTWSEEFYRLTSKAVLTKIFTYFKEKTGKNPTLLQISYVLRSKETLAEVLVDSEEDDLKDHKKTYEHVLGLKHQIETLCTGNLAKILSPTETIESFSLKESIHNGDVVYFRLPSLTNFETASMVGKLVIADLAFIAGSHQKEGKTGKFCPVFLDEFSCFVCDAFRRLIGLARSAGLALHYSHQSLGDLRREDPSFFTTLSDSTATKIAMRVGDYETADYISKLFGTHTSFKITERVDRDLDEDEHSLEGKGSLRETQSFNLDPNVLKSTHIGEGHVFVAHGDKSATRATHYMPIIFPKFK